VNSRIAAGLNTAGSVSGVEFGEAAASLALV
jgi:hypothetical protein